MRSPGGRHRVSRPTVATVAGVALVGLVGSGLALSGTVIWSPSAVADEPPVVSPAGDQGSELPGKSWRSADRHPHPRQPRQDGTGAAPEEAEGPSGPEPVKLRPASGTDGPAAGDRSGPATGEASGGDPATDATGGQAASAARSESPGNQPAAPPDLASGEAPDHAADRRTGDEVVADERFTPVAASVPGGLVGLLGVIATVCVVAVSAGAVRTILNHRAVRAESR